MKDISAISSIVLGLVYFVGIPLFVPESRKREIIRTILFLIATVLYIAAWPRSTFAWFATGVIFGGSIVLWMPKKSQKKHVL